MYRWTPRFPLLCQGQIFSAVIILDNAMLLVGGRVLGENLWTGTVECVREFSGSNSSLAKSSSIEACKLEVAFSKYSYTGRGDFIL